MRNCRAFSVDAKTHIFHDPNKIRYHSCSCRQTACPRPVEHRFPYRFTVNIYCIVFILNRCKRMRLGKQCRLDTYFHLLPLPMGNPDQLHDVPKLLAVLQVFFRNIRNAFNLYIIKVNIHGKTQCRQDRHFPCCIKALHICSRVAFRISQLLSFFQDVLISAPILAHFSQNKVRCPIHNSHHFCNSIRSQTIYQPS